MDKRNMDLWKRYIKVFIIVSCYWVISISTVFVNKALLSGQKVPLEAPLFITWFQCVFSFAICAYLSVTGGIYKIFIFPKDSPWSLDIFKKVIPLSVMFTLMIATNNLSLKYVSLSFYYIGRSLTTVFNVVLSWFIMRQATSAKCLVCCAIIILGFWLGVDQEHLLGSFSLIGTIYGVIGSLVLALFSIYTKKTLPLVDQQVWLLTYCINAYSVVLFLPLMALNGEIQVIWNYAHFNSVRFWLQMIIGGLCGLAVGHFTSLQIKVTSPLTHNVSGTAKACTQTVLATQWHHEGKNVLWWLSNAIVLISSGLYAWFKQMEMEEHSKKTVHHGEDKPVEKYSITLEPPSNILAEDNVYPVDKYSRVSLNLEDTAQMEECINRQIDSKHTEPENKSPGTPIHRMEEYDNVNEENKESLRTPTNLRRTGQVEKYSTTGMSLTNMHTSEEYTRILDDNQGNANPLTLFSKTENSRDDADKYSKINHDGTG